MSRFEVGVRVEGYAVGEERRHINSAFITFRPVEETISLPKLIVDTVEQKCRASNAVARHYLWLDRYTVGLVLIAQQNSYIPAFSCASHF